MSMETITHEAIFREKYSWQSVYYHFQKWSKNGSWESVWNSIQKKHKHLLDLSSIQLDGTHTPAKRGGESVAYQGQKKSKTTNISIISLLLLIVKVFLAYINQ